MRNNNSATFRRTTRRFVLQVGFTCNARCRFCYYKESLEKGEVRDFTTKEIKAKLREARSLGCDMVDISGGEPTIRKDIIEIISYAKKIGYVRICMLTNGIRTVKSEFTNKLVDAGINEVLLSIHSPIEKNHDWLTRVPGSYKKLITTLKNFSKRKEVDIKVNSTISSANYKLVEDLFILTKPYKPKQINLLVLNPSNESIKGKETGVAVKNYRLITREIKKAIEKYEKDFEIINVRWIPFCLLKGHEEKIRTMWQKMYEDAEWDPYLNIKYNFGLPKVIASFLAGLVLYPFKAPRYGQRDLYTFFNECLTTFRGIYYYRQTQECQQCALKKICPGLSRSYLKKFGLKTKLSAYKQKKEVNDPLHYIKQHKKHIPLFESLRLSED